MWFNSDPNHSFENRWGGLRYKYSKVKLIENLENFVRLLIIGGMESIHYNIILPRPLPHLISMEVDSKAKQMICVMKYSKTNQTND